MKWANHLKVGFIAKKRNIKVTIAMFKVEQCYSYIHNLAILLQPNISGSGECAVHIPNISGQSCTVNMWIDDVLNNYITKNE